MMASWSTIRSGAFLTLLCSGMWLLYGTSDAADPKAKIPAIKPLTKEEQEKIDKAIEKGVEFLKKAQTKQGDFLGKMSEETYFVGQCALPAYALLESGVPADDPVIQKAATYIRALIANTDSTYELALAILFFDRLGDPKDRKVIQGCALRLIAGQHLTGGWAYRCPILSEKNAADLMDCLAALDKRRKGGERTRDQALAGLTIPPALEGLSVFQKASRLPWQEPSAAGGDAIVAMHSAVELAGRTDNSNTQFALLGLWVARGKGVSVDPVLELSVERFERFHTSPGGFWLYEIDRELSTTSRISMTCVGLIGLAIGRGLKLPTPGSPEAGKKDVHIMRGLWALSRQIGRPSGDMSKRVTMEDTYFLWSLERVGMLYNMRDIGGKDWYRWGAEGLLTNQTRQGWWPDTPLEKRWKPRASGQLKPALNTSFALLFLKRSHPMKGLTAKLPFTEKELNEGIASSRPRDKYSFRSSPAPSPSKEK